MPSRRAPVRPRATLKLINPDADPPDERPSPAFLRELARRVEDSVDPVRYVLVSVFRKDFLLYYDVESDCYAFNAIEDATAFKRLRVARAVRAAVDPKLFIMKARV